MSFKTSAATLAAAVATSGTFTVSYPDGTQAGSFSGAHGHKMWVDKHQKLYTAPSDFSLSFGASSITVTYLGTTSIPAGARVNLQLDVFGADDREPSKALVKTNIRQANSVLLDLGSPVTADADGVAASQSVSAGAAFSLNGALVQSGVAVFDVPRNVVAAWTTTSILTITGTDVDGNTVVEKSASGASHTGKKAFKTVTSVTSSASITGATVGSGNVIGLPRFVPDASYVKAEFANGALLARKPTKLILTGRVLCTDGTYGVAHVGFAGTLKAIRTVEIDGGIGTNDAVLTFKIGTTSITNGVVTVATSGSAAGVKDTASPSAANVVASGDAINVTVSGTPGSGKSVAVELEFDLTGAQAMDGTFVAGVTSAATATTGDTRGTYSPSTTPDGTIGYLLVADMPDPANKGVAQYTG